MKKLLAASITLSLALATVGAVTAFALTGNGDDKLDATESPADSNTQASTRLPTNEEWPSDQSDGTISPGLPTYNEWLYEKGGAQISEGISTYEEWLEK